MNIVVRRASIVIGLSLITAIACGDNWLTHPRAAIDAATFAKKCPPNNPHCKTVDTVPPVPIDTTPTDTTPTPAPTPPPDGTSAVLPAPPTLLNTSVALTPSNGRISRVLPSGDVQAALDSARAGDVILLAAGSTFTGNFVVRPTARGAGLAGEWVTVTTDGACPAEGTRATPTTAATFPKLVSPNSLEPLTFVGPVARWRFICVETTTAASQSSSNATISIGVGNETSITALPTDIILDRLYVHGSPTMWLHRCITFNGARNTLVDSYVSECHADIDAQAIGGWNGPGPYKIVGNYLEASTEDIVFGGADPVIQGLVPSDIEIRRNWITRPMSWKGGPWLEKNLIEFKNARRVVIEANVLENAWPNGQLGWAFVFWSVNQQGSCTWCVTSDVLVQNNLIRNVTSGVQLSAQYGGAVPMSRIAFRNNLFVGVNDPSVSGSGYGFITGGAVNQVTIEHNTLFFPNVSAFQWDGLPLANLVVQNNLVGAYAYPLWSNGVNGWADEAGPGSVFAGNVIATDDYGSAFLSMVMGRYPAGNSFVWPLDVVGFVGGRNAALSSAVAPTDLSLSSTSPYKGKATDGTDPGANVSAVLTATAGVKP